MKAKHPTCPFCNKGVQCKNSWYRCKPCNVKLDIRKCEIRGAYIDVNDIRVYLHYTNQTTSILRRTASTNVYINHLSYSVRSNVVRWQKPKPHLYSDPYDYYDIIAEVNRIIDINPRTVASTVDKLLMLL